MFSILIMRCEWRWHTFPPLSIIRGPICLRACQQHVTRGTSQLCWPSSALVSHMPGTAGQPTKHLRLTRGCRSKGQATAAFCRCVGWGTGTTAEWCSVVQAAEFRTQCVTLAGLCIRLSTYVFQSPDFPCRKSQSLSIFIKSDKTLSLKGRRSEKCFIIMSCQLLSDIWWNHIKHNYIWGEHVQVLMSLYSYSLSDFLIFIFQGFVCFIQLN